MEYTNVQAIKAFFEMSAAEAMKEIKPLSEAERKEIGAMCASALGGTIKEQ